MSAPALRHFLNLCDAGGDAIAAMLADAIDRKTARAAWPKGRVDADAPLAGHVLAMIFEKNSTRTRASFDMAIRQLGGSAMVMEAGSMQIGRGETIADTARVLSRYVDAIMIRTDDHAKIEELAEYASVPVINGLTDLSHPCQIVADLLTIVEGGKALPGLELAWLGDGNNVLASLIEAAGLFGFNVRAGVPQGYDPDMRFVEAARAQGARIDILRDAAEAVAGADIVVTDTWVSMGQDHAHNKLAAMAPYQVDERLMGKAKGDALFLHCLPAHRGEEVVDAVIDGAQSRVWDEAENRVHAQKSVLLWALGKL
ncbi:MAG: ornithine carbamoyltransferase [Sphingopyxis terrae]|uniref:ornithine carbamoyltransferase n=1 Tax=Sphingopyxis terrae TaxID=33052 RepID=UPI003F823299